MNVIASSKRSMFTGVLIFSFIIASGCGGGGTGGSSGNGPSTTNNAPTASAQNIAAFTETAVSIILTGTDNDNDTLTYIIESDPSNGTLSGNSPNLFYTSDNDFTGKDSFTFSAFDGQTYSSAATVIINISESSDPDPDTDPDPDSDTEPDAQVRTVGIFYVSSADLGVDGYFSDPIINYDWYLFEAEDSAKALIEKSTYGKIVLDADLNDDGKMDFHRLYHTGDGIYDVNENINIMRQEGIVPIDDYDHKVFFFWLGRGTEPYHEASAITNGEIVWISANTTSWWGPYTMKNYFAHEIGHNLGLWHEVDGEYGYMRQGEMKNIPLPFYQRQQLDEKHGLGLFTDNHVQEIDLTTPGDYTIDLAPLENNPWEETRPMAFVIDGISVSFRFQDGPFLTSDYANEEGRLHLHNGYTYLQTLSKNEIYGSSSSYQFSFDESSENGATVHVTVY